MSDYWYEFDLYPRDDPKDGDRLVRFTKLQSAEYRDDANGVGEGQLSIRGDDAEAQFIDPAGLQYVRVVRVDGTTVDGATTSGFDEAVVGGFWLENGDFEALTEKQTRLLKFRGAGTMAYLQRAVMWNHSYYFNYSGSGGHIPLDSVDGAWFDETYNPNHTLGYIWWRLMIDAMHFRVGTTPYSHIHADDRAIHTDIHDDDRLENALVDLTLGFIPTTDSSANAWTVPWGTLRIPVGASMLEVAKMLMEAGLYIQMNPDTFVLDAYEAAVHRRDRSGVAWGASVVRFQKTTDGTIATSNVKSNMTRGIAAFIKRSILLVGGTEGNYATSTSGGSDIPWEGFHSIGAKDTADLEQMADIQIAARADAGDISRLRGMLGNDPDNGKYLPFETVGVLLDDIATVHTGTGQWDFNEDEYPVSAITLAKRVGGDWDVYYDLGAAYSSMTERGFQTAPVAHHSHPPNPELCRPTTAVDPTFVVSASNVEGAVGPGSMTVPSGLTNSAMFIAVPGILPSTFPPPAVSWNGEAATLYDSITHGTQGGIALYYILSPSPGAAMLDSSNSNGTLGGWLFEGVNQSAPIAGWAEATGTSATAAAALAFASGALPIAAMSVDDDDFVNDAFSAPVPAAGMDSDWAVAGQAGTPGFRDMQYAGGHGDWSASWTLNESHPWSAFLAAVAGVSSDGGGDDPPADTVLQGEETHGTSVRATRCDHAHAHGLLCDHGTHYHEADQIHGASGVTDHGALTGLADDDHPQYLTSAEHTAIVHDGPTEAQVRDAGRWEVLMADGVTFPPDPLQTEDGTDWLYGWVSG